MAFTGDDPNERIARLQVLDSTSGSTRIVWDYASADLMHEFFHQLLLYRKPSICKKEKQNPKG